MPMTKLKLAATIFPAFAALFGWVGITSDVMATFGAPIVLAEAVVLAGCAAYSVAMFEFARRPK